MTEENLVVIRTDPTTPGMVMIFEMFFSISAFPIGVLFRETINNMLAVNVAM